MKKSLLLTAAALMAASAVNAQPVVAKTMPALSSIPASVDAVQPFQNYSEVATMATPAQRKANAKRRADATLKAWYNRPAGSFYRSMTSGLSAFYNAMIWNPFLKDVTYTNASTGAKSYSWQWQQYDTDVDSFTVRNSTATNLVINTQVRESALAPALTAINGSNTDVYKMTGHYYDDQKNTTEDYETVVVYNSDPVATMTEDYKSQNMTAYLSPKWFSAGTRQGQSRGVGAFKGAKDADGNTNGLWFGRNWSGWNGMAMYVEKPASRYALRGLQVAYTSYKGTGDATLTARLYKVHKVASNIGGLDSLVLDDLMGTATATLDTTMAEYGLLPFTFQEVEAGLPYDVTLDIDYAYAIVLSGYDNDNIDSWTMLISYDQYDEGYGQHGYMLHINDKDSITAEYGLDNFFSSPLGVTAPTIFLDVEYPVLDFWYVNPKTGEPIGKNVEFAANGGKNDVEFYSTHASDEWTVADKDGNDLPSWLTYTLSDSTANDEYTGHSHMVLTAEALPAGVTGRAATVKVSYPGAEQFVYVTQGNVSGVNQVATSNVVVRVENGDFVVNATAGAQAKVYNVAGQLVREATLSEGSNVIDGQSLSNGVYLVKIGNKTVKVVK